MMFLPNWKLRLLVGLILGTIIVTVDNVAFQGEVSPIVIVILLLVATVTVGWLWGWRAWISVAALWAGVPLAHAFKLLLGLPDTLYPNTSASILLLALFTFAVSTTGFLIGVLFHKVTNGTAKGISGID
jgi:hypothetical protein